MCCMSLGIFKIQKSWKRLLTSQNRAWWKGGAKALLCASASHDEALKGCLG